MAVIDDPATIYMAMQQRHAAAYAALGLVRSMVRWGSMPESQLPIAQEIVGKADAADALLDE